jgi:secreted PhoX family phosphatase
VRRAGGSPVTFAQLSANPSAPIISAMHTYGRSFATRWVDVHSGTGTFDATSAAAAASATPFKRPENGMFRPGTGFHQFFFTETGDTTSSSTLPGAFGAVFKLKMPTMNRGRLTPAFVGNIAHTGLDNLAFATADRLLVVEDAGDSLHEARNALDSGYVIDVSRAPGSQPPKRWLAEGRDASATYDATTSPGYNDGDNEITGIHVSNGDTSVNGILGAKVPTALSHGWRVFWTQQHGDNTTWEVTPRG